MDKTTDQHNKDVHKNIYAMGAVSFFNDMASEMVYPIIPIFLTSFLGLPVSIVGLIEGIAESTASLLKVFSGWFSDRLQKRKPFLLFGYTLSFLGKIILGFAHSWPMVLFARFTDRFGKGSRSSASDALIAENSNKCMRGKSYGVHRAFDTAGAVVGPLIAFLLLKTLDSQYNLMFFIAAIPGLIGVILLIIFVKEKKKRAIPTQHVNAHIRWRSLNPSFKLFLIVSIIFAIGNSSDAFLILRAESLGLSAALAVFAYVLFNVAYAIFAIPAGSICDKIGPKKLIIIGFLIYSLVYISFGIIHSSIYLWFLFPIYGIYMALTEGVGKAYISTLVPTKHAASSFGLYQTLIGVCMFFSSYIAGILWSKISPNATFLFGGIVAIIAAFLFLLLEKDKKQV